MLYIAYLPKKRKEHLEDRKINKILQWYMSKADHEYSLISVPGFLSTSCNTIDGFLYELNNLLSGNSKRIKIGFLNGMNGHNYVSNSPWGTIYQRETIIERHNRILSNYNFDRIYLNAKKDKEHRKMLLFFTPKNDESIPNELPIQYLDDFLEKIDVGAILIGSSNQSFTTYFDKKASKGEADIFMFDADLDHRIKTYIDQLREHSADSESLFEDIVLTESFYGQGHNNTQEFFKSIFKEVLENGLM